MTASRASRPLRSFPRAALILVVVLSPLAGAGAQPVPSSPPAAPPPAGEAGIGFTVQPMPVLTADAIGVLTEAGGGLGPAMWRATDRALVEAALLRLPSAAPSPAMRQLARRLLLSAAVPPAGSGRIALLDLRATLLWRMGDLDGLRRLAEAVPASAYAGTLVRLDVERRWLQGDAGRACEIAAIEVGRDASVFWQQAAVFCQARAGDQAKAALGLALLREQNGEDSLLAALIRAMAGEPASIRSLPDLSPLHLAAARAAKVALPDDTGSRAPLPIAAAIAGLAEAPPIARLRAADRAASAGALPPAALRAAYAAAAPAAADVNADSAEGRAAFYRQVLAQTSSESRLEWLGRGLAAARKQERFALTAAIYEPELRAAPPVPGLAALAGELVPALLLLGERGGAESWLRLASERADSDAASANAVVRAFPAAAIAGLPLLAESADSDALAAWSAAVRATPAGRETATRVLALRAAIGEPVAEPLFAGLLEGPITRSAVVPQPVVGVLLEGAIAGRRVGLGVLMALVAIGERGPAAADTATLARSLEGLRSLGFGAEAREMAIEAVAAMP